VKFEAEQKVARAQAEAQTLKLQKDQITPQLIQLVRTTSWQLRPKI